MRLGRLITTALVGGVLWLLPTEAQAQAGSVAGRIVDDVTREPVAGASVAIAETGGLTNESGRFSIDNVPAGVHELRVSMIGYAEATRTITVLAGQTNVLDLSLSTQAIELGELVVIGYGTQSTNDLTSSIEQVDPEEFNTGRITSPQQLIAGKVAGVNIVDSGEPGGGVAVRFRGGTSISSSNNPLYVVDGVPLPVGFNDGAAGGLGSGRNPLNFINSADIESITVLKDASATAIYGSRGANGVVIIETRGGRGTGLQGSRLSYSGNISSSTVTENPDMLSTAQFRAAVEGWGGRADTLLGGSSTNWMEEIERSGIGHDHNVALEGGSADVNYRLSVGYLSQEGVIRNSETERATVSINYGQNFFEDLVRFTANVKGAMTEDRFNADVVGGAALFNPTVPVESGNNDFGGFFEFGDSDLGPVNPMAELTYHFDEGRTYRSVGDIEAEVSIPWVTGLKGTMRLGYDIADVSREVFRPSFLFSETRRDSLAGYISHYNPSERTRLFDTYFTYGTRLSSLGDIDFMAGYSYEDWEGRYPFFSVSGLSTDVLGTNEIPTTVDQVPDMGADGEKLVSFFGRSNINLFERYLITLSIRRDGSSKFGPEEDYGTFPAVAFAWRVSEESFMDNVDFFNNLKLRASWGVNGNKTIGSNWAFSRYVAGTSTAQYQFGELFIPTIRPDAYNEFIKWEETTSWNVGFDWSILSDRFSGALDYYVKNTDDLLFLSPVPAGANLSNIVMRNIGEVQNRGFELSVDAQLFGGDEPGAFWWTAGFTAAHNDGEVVRIFGDASNTILTGGIAGGVGNNIQILRPGLEPNAFYVYEHRRENGLPVYEDTDGDGSIEDIEMYVDQRTDPCPDDPEALCADGVINQDDRRPYKSPNPDWVLGHSSRMGWGAFDAGFTLRAHLGNYVYNNVASNYGHYRALRYVDVPNNLHSSVLETGFETEQYFSDYYVEDASFLRMDNLTLGYTLDPFNSGQQVRLFGTVQNVFTLTEYRGVDPLAGIGGIDNNLYPRSRTFVAGANVTF